MLFWKSGHVFACDFLGRFFNALLLYLLDFFVEIICFLFFAIFGDRFFGVNNHAHDQIIGVGDVLNTAVFAAVGFAFHPDRQIGFSDIAAARAGDGNAARVDTKAE